MMHSQLPLLSGNQRPLFPPDGKCPVCKTRFSDSKGFAYINSGTLSQHDELDSNALKLLSPSSFMNIGYHGDDPEMKNSVDCAVVDDLQSEQFEINTCSLKCLRKLLNQILDHLESELRTK